MRPRFAGAGRDRRAGAAGQRIAVARDEAFSFFYPHLALSWREAGAELKFFSPLADEPPPSDCDICWLPGGYPELHAGRIAAAARFLKGLRLFAESRPVHGECGGYMTLGRALVDGSGQAHVMAGLLSLETSFLRRKLHLGYRRAVLGADHCLGTGGTLLSGHEFHYVTTTKEEGSHFAMIRDAYGGAGAPMRVARGPRFRLIFPCYRMKKRAAGKPAAQVKGGNAQGGLRSESNLAAMHPL